MNRNDVRATEIEAKRFGFDKVNHNGKPRWAIKCAGCGVTGEVYRPDIDTVDPLVSHFAKRGWVLARDQPPCHSTPCYRSFKAAQKKEAAMPTPSPSPPLHGPQPDPKVIRRVITLLNAHFDAETGKYVEGWNDARVAKDADALLSFVIKYREEGYGALAEDPEVVELRADIKKLNDEFALHASETADRLAGLTTRLEALAAKKMAGQG